MSTKAEQARRYLISIGAQAVELANTLDDGQLERIHDWARKMDDEMPSDPSVWDEEPDREPSAEQEKAWNEQFDGTSFGA